MQIPNTFPKREELIAAGITSLEDLGRKSDEEILAIEGIEPDDLPDIHAAQELIETEGVENFDSDQSNSVASETPIQSRFIPDSKEDLDIDRQVRDDRSRELDKITTAIADKLHEKGTATSADVVHTKTHPETTKNRNGTITARAWTGEDEE